MGAHIGLVVGQIGELAAREGYDLRVDFVEPKPIPGLSIGREGPRTKPNDPDCKGLVTAQLSLATQRKRHPGGGAVIGDWLFAPLRIEVLRPVLSRPVLHPAHDHWSCTGLRVRPRSHTERAMRRMRIMTEAA